MTAALPRSVGSSRHRPLLFWAWLVASAGSTFLLPLFPMVAPIVLVASTALLLGWQLVTRGRLPLAMPMAVIVVLLVIDIYLLITCSWSLRPADALRSVALLIAITVVLYLTLNALDEIDSDVLRAIAIGLVAGVALGGALLCVEAFTAQAVQRALMFHFPALMPKAHHMEAGADGTTMIRAYMLNRGISVLAVLFWPMVLLVDRLALTGRQRVWLLIALIPCALAVMRSVHGTSKVAFIGAALAFGIYQLYPRLVTWLTRAGWVAAVLLVVPMATLAFSSQLYLSSWLSESAQHRIVIWGYTASQLSRAPVLGVGVASARARNEPDNLDTRLAPGSKYPLSTGSHSHNAYLQVWYETGAIGAALLLGLGLLVLKRIAGAPEATQGHLYATFTACAVLAASAFSIWSPWLLAAFGIVAVCIGLGLALHPAPPRAGEAAAGGALP